ncbi:MAG: hypothetical protein ACOZAQ_06675 [Pseudomonadota bacterium]
MIITPEQIRMDAFLESMKKPVKNLAEAFSEINRGDVVNMTMIDVINEISKPFLEMVQEKAGRDIYLCQFLAMTGVRILNEAGFKARVAGGRARFVKRSTDGHTFLFDSGFCHRTSQMMTKTIGHFWVATEFGILDFSTMTFGKYDPGRVFFPFSIISNDPNSSKLPLYCYQEIGGRGARVADSELIYPEYMPSHFVPTASYETTWLSV